MLFGLILDIFVLLLCKFNKINVAMMFIPDLFILIHHGQI